MDYFDYYKEAKELSAELRKAKLQECADQIIEAIEGGSTGTEICMALRWNIGKLLKEKKVPYKIRERAVLLYEKLDRELQRI